ncbi:unnamed protein product [Euphydryas editha]|uniref:Reverse transcriptase domain-containing protein n=1 Tax=Euphydryas editha TaxID=104508 RepID=A0AAU9TUI3_EUPED|nr:unnamed protein product [Euphydryas editha]
MAEFSEDLRTMLDDLDGVSQRQGLKMNMEKIKIMANVHVYGNGNSNLEVDNKYIHLGERSSLVGSTLRERSIVESI